MKYTFNMRSLSQVFSLENILNVILCGIPVVWNGERNCMFGAVNYVEWKRFIVKFKLRNSHMPVNQCPKKRFCNKIYDSFILNSWHQTSKNEMLFTNLCLKVINIRRMKMYRKMLSAHLKTNEFPISLFSMVTWPVDYQEMDVFMRLAKIWSVVQFFVCVILYKLYVSVLRTVPHTLKVVPHRFDGKHHERWIEFRHHISSLCSVVHIFQALCSSSNVVRRASERAFCTQTHTTHTFTCRLLEGCHNVSLCLMHSLRIV